EEHCSPVRKNGVHSADGSVVNMGSRNSSRLLSYDENSCPPNLYSTSSSQNSSHHLNQSMPNLTAINGTSKEPSHCKVCKRDIHQEEVLLCADCGVMSHPICLDIGGELLEAIRLYKWQCMDCKS